MITEKELTTLNYLRKNSRENLVKISKETKIPVSTLYNIIKKLESKVILKYVSLLDFSRMGYNLKVNFVISSNHKEELKKFLMKSLNVNSLYSLVNGYDFYLECIFKNLKDIIKFKEKLEEFKIKCLEEIFIVDEFKKEGFYL